MNKKENRNDIAELTEAEYAIVLESAEDDFRIKAQKFHQDLIKGIVK